MRGYVTAAIAAGALVSVHVQAARAAIVFEGFKADTLCCGASSRIGLDWSSDFGIDYQMTSDNNPGLFVPNQLLNPGPVWNLGSYEANRAVEMRLSRTLAADMALASAGRIEIGAAGAVGLGTVHNFNHHLTLASSSNQYGVSASALLNGDFLFSGVSVATPLYWGIEWSITIVDPDGQPTPNGLANLVIEDSELLPQPYAYGALGTARTITGSAFGSNTDGLFRVSSDSKLESTGFGEMIWDLRIAFAGESFADIPDIVAVPVPGGLALFAAVAALALGRRRAERR